MNNLEALKIKLAALERKRDQIEKQIDALGKEWNEVDNQIAELHFQIESHNGLRSMFEKINPNYN